MAANPQSFPLSPEAYLALERQSDVRSKYIQGQVTMMTGASREHNNIVVNFTRELSLHLLEKPCEVLSPGTESKDRGKKFDASRRIPALREYILVSQDEPLVERYTRQEKDVWLLQVSRGLDATLLIAAIDCTLPLQLLYIKVSFPTTPTE